MFWKTLKPCLISENFFTAFFSHNVCLFHLEFSGTSQQRKWHPLEICVLRKNNFVNNTNVRVVPPPLVEHCFHASPALGSLKFHENFDKIGRVWWQFVEMNENVKSTRGNFVNLCEFRNNIDNRMKFRENFEKIVENFLRIDEEIHSFHSTIRARNTCT